jgi:plasmid stabilization system protein ParE
MCVRRQRLVGASVWQRTSCGYFPRSVVDWPTVMRRELIVPFGSGAYVLRYRLDTATDTVIIIRVWHSRELRG